MIEGLDHLLESRGQPGLAQLRGLLRELLGGHEAEGRLIEEQTLQPRGLRVFRLRFAINGHVRQVIVKRLRPEIALRGALIAERWMPAVGMRDSGPALLGSVAEPGGNCVWHVYDDLGPFELLTNPLDPDSVSAAIKLVAQLHMQFARHPLLGEVRLHGCDLGIHFYAASVRDATYALEACQPSHEQASLHGRLLERLSKLRQELPQRSHVLDAWGGPETLLHAIYGTSTFSSSPPPGGSTCALSIGTTPRSDRQATTFRLSSCACRLKSGPGFYRPTVWRRRVQAGVRRQVEC